MKKSILRTFAVIVALLIFCQSLTVGFITSADNISNIPERYPQRTVYKFENVIDYKSGAPSSEETTVRLSSPVNFTSADYDNLEFDLFVESELKSLPFKMGVFDSQGKTAVFAADADTGFWLHISIATANFAASNTDLTDICGCMIVDPQKDTRYVVANICLTGIARTAEWPDADLQKLSARIDLTDDDKKSTSSAIIRFDDLEQVDLLKSDWLEFDIYVAGIRADSIDSVQTLAFVDKDQTDGLSFGKNSARYNKFTVKTNTWSHIKVPTRDLTIHATCDTTQIIGVQIRDMTDNYRYVLTNLCLSTKNTTPPPMPENAQVIKSGIFTEYFCDKQGDETPLYDAPQVFDLTKREHIRFDILADTVKATEHNLNFIITDKNGLKATYEFVFKPGNWVSVKALVKALNAEDGFDFTACKSVNVAGIEQNARYFIANLCQTSADIDIPDNDYPNNASKKFNDFSVDYFTGNSADAKEGTYFSFDKTDLRENSYIEFDMFVDTGLDSSPLPKKIALYFVDENSRRFKATANYEYNKAACKSFNLGA